MTEDEYELISKVAHDVLMLSRNTLLVNLRFMDNAISQFEYFPQNKGTYATNGKMFIYNPINILKRYLLEKEIPTRDYLHIMMHCIFQHMYGSMNVQREIWDLACDIAVEYSISELNIKAVKCKRENEQILVINELKKNVKILTTEKIYRYYLDQNLSINQLCELRKAFEADDHEMWYSLNDESDDFDDISDLSVGENGEDEKKNADRNGNEGEEGGDTNGNEGEKNEESNGNNGEEGDEGDGEITSDKKKKISIISVTNKQQQIWKDIAEYMQMDMESFSKRQGTMAGSLMQNLSAINRERYDYTSFLKKFAVMNEVMKINDDEFDYVYYTYGLKLYGKVPLIEPLEYKDVKRIKEFVIAIDTSGSTAGELVQKFVQKTYNILKSTESFASKINLHIIQCDAEIQEHVKITKQEEFDQYIKNMKIKGLGGTDFRPVFNFVENLINNKEFTNLKGLIYFTDGYGVFPMKKPIYDTAFVFIDDEHNNPDIPSWAIKLVLQRDEV